MITTGKEEVICLQVSVVVDMVKIDGRIGSEQVECENYSINVV